MKFEVETSTDYITVEGTGFTIFDDHLFIKDRDITIAVFAKGHWENIVEKGFKVETD